VARNVSLTKRQRIGFVGAVNDPVHLFTPEV
jgi:hypothetical protein